MDIERIGDRDAVGQQLAQAAAARRREWAQNPDPASRDTSAVIAMSPPDAPMIRTLRPRERPSRVEQLERFAQRAQGVAAGNARLPAERLEHLVGARQRAGVAVRGARRGRRAPGLDDGDGLAGRAAPVGGARKSLRILDALEIQAECRDARIVAQNLDQILDRQAASDCRR